MILENKIYNKPFIYYSQSHIIGTDIKQDKYPSLLGLCIIDKNIIYTTLSSLHLPYVLRLAM